MATRGGIRPLALSLDVRTLDDLENDEELKLKVENTTQVPIDGRQSSIDNLREGAQVRGKSEAQSDKK
jgi:hypothetical protein